MMDIIVKWYHLNSRIELAEMSKMTAGLMVYSSPMPSPLPHSTWYTSYSSTRKNFDIAPLKFYQLSCPLL